MSAAEAFNFAWIFGFLVSDRADEENQTWNIYTTFWKTLDIVSSPKFVKGHLVQLEYLIQKFLFECTKYYGEFQYKFHDLTHIIRVIKGKGPVFYFSSMRYESKTEIKPYATLSKITINTPKSLCISNLLKLAYLKFTGKFEAEKEI